MEKIKSILFRLLLAFIIFTAGAIMGTNSFTDAIETRGEVRLGLKKYECTVRVLK